MDFDDLPPRGNHKLAFAKAQEEASFLGLTRRDPKILCTNVGIMQRVEADGPWEFCGTMDIPDGQFAGRLEYVLRVNKDYPNSCPHVRIISNPSLRRHPYLHENELAPAFYRQLESYRMRDVVAMVKHFFSTYLPGLEKIESLVETRYRPLRKHSELFDALHINQFLDSQFLNAASLSDILRPVDADGCTVYTFSLFNRHACTVFLEEIDNFYESKLPARRPNSMNNYGIIVNNIGLEPFINGLMERLQPIGEYLFPGAGHEWDSHHSFVVRYAIGEDVGLDLHTDDSDVTFNVNLGCDFAGGDLQLCGVLGHKDHRKSKVRIKHEVGRCIVHRGRQRHGACPITAGERMNLIMWMRSSTYRRSVEYRNPPYVQEAGPPDVQCLSYTHDRDYGVFKTYDETNVEHDGGGWCPPAAYEYDNFQSEKATQKK